MKICIFSSMILRGENFRTVREICIKNPSSSSIWLGLMWGVLLEDDVEALPLVPLFDSAMVDPTVDRTDETGPAVVAVSFCTITPVSHVKSSSMGSNRSMQAS